MKRIESRLSQDRERGFKLKPGEIKLFNALSNHEEGLTFKELKEITGLSHTALAIYLKEKLQIGLIRKDYERRKYLLNRIYLPMKKFPNEWQKQMKMASVAFLQLGREISKIDDQEKRRMALEKFLRSTFHMLTLYIWKVLGEAIADYQDDIKNLENQDLAVQRGTIIKDAMHDWISGIADCLAVGILLNIDIVDDAAEEWYNEVKEKATEYNRELVKLIRPLAD